MEQSSIGDGVDDFLLYIRWGLYIISYLCLY